MSYKKGFSRYINTQNYFARKNGAKARLESLNLFCAEYDWRKFVLRE